MATGTAISAPLRLLSALRIKSWMHFLVLPLAAIEPARLSPGTLAGAMRGVLIAFCVLAFGYLLNGVADREMDASPGKNPLADGAPPGRGVHALLGALAALSLSLALAAPVVVLFATVICLSSGLLYSVGPRLKRFVVVGTWMNVTNFAPLLFVGLSASEWPAHLAPLVAIFSALLLQNQLLHEAADREEDARGRVVTTVRAWGPLWAAAHAAAVGAVVVVVAFDGAVVGGVGGGAVTLSLSVACAALFVVVFPTWLWRRGARPAAMSHARRAHRYACMAVGAAFYVLGAWS